MQYRHPLPQCRVAGIRFHRYEAVGQGLDTGDTLTLRRDADNRFDPNAVAVYHGDDQIGFVEKGTAPAVAAYMDYLPGAAEYRATVVVHDTSPETSDYNRLVIQPYVLSEHEDAHSALMQVLDP